MPHQISITPPTENKQTIFIQSVSFTKEWLRLIIRTKNLLSTFCDKLDFLQFISLDARTKLWKWKGISNTDSSCKMYFTFQTHTQVSASSDAITHRNPISQNHITFNVHICEPPPRPSLYKIFFGTFYECYYINIIIIILRTWKPKSLILMRKNGR